MEHPKDPCGPCGSAYGAPTTASDDDTSDLPCTFCDRDKYDNVWAPGADPTGVLNPCLLDTMCESEIVNIIEHDDRARADLKKITSNAHLLHLAEAVPRLPGVEEGDRLQTQINRSADSMVLYTHFRGIPPFNQ
jgi:hypothetical protein